MAHELHNSLSKGGIVFAGDVSGLLGALIAIHVADIHLPGAQGIMHNSSSVSHFKSFAALIIRIWAIDHTILTCFHISKIS